MQQSCKKHAKLAIMPDGLWEYSLTERSRARVDHDIRQDRKHQSLSASSWFFRLFSSLLAIEIGIFYLATISKTSLDTLVE